MDACPYPCALVEVFDPLPRLGARLRRGTDAIADRLGELRVIEDPDAERTQRSTSRQCTRQHDSVAAARQGRWRYRSVEIYVIAASAGCNMSRPLCSVWFRRCRLKEWHPGMGPSRSDRIAAESSHEHGASLRGPEGRFCAAPNRRFGRVLRSKVKPAARRISAKARRSRPDFDSCERSR
jgi:hypothetical protein